MKISEYERTSLNCFSSMKIEGWDGKDQLSICAACPNRFKHLSGECQMVKTKKFSFPQSIILKLKIPTHIVQCEHKIPLGTGIKFLSDSTFESMKKLSNIQKADMSVMDFGKALKRLKYD